MTEQQNGNDATRFGGRWTAAAAMAMAAVALAVAGVAIGFAAVDYQPPRGTEPPKVTDWMQGWGSIVGVIAGLIAALFTGFLVFHEMGEARRARRDATEEREQARRDRELIAQERRDAEAEQARSVVLSELRFLVKNHTHEGVATQSIAKVAGTLRNFGVAPILDVRAFLVGQGIFADVRIPVGGRNVLKPGGSLVPIEKHLNPPLDAAGRSAAQLGQQLWIMVEFTDANGRRWRRNGAAQPERLLDSAEAESLSGAFQHVNVNYI